GERPIARPEVPELYVPERLHRAVDRVAVVVPAGRDPEVRVRLAEDLAGLGPSPSHGGGRRDLVHALLESEVVDLEPRRVGAARDAPAPRARDLVEIEIGAQTGE